MFCLVLTGIVTGGANYDNNLIYALAFLGCGLFLTSLVQTYLQLLALELEWLPPAPVCAGEQARFPLLVWTPGGTPRRALKLAWRPARRGPGLDFVIHRGRIRGLRLVWRAAGREPGARKQPGLSVPARSSSADALPGMTRLVLAVPTSRRGQLVLQAGRVSLSTHFPLGLFRSWLYLPQAPPCLVYPRPAGRALPPSTSQGARSSDAVGARQPGSEDFIGVSAYRPGDPIRRISWRAAARGEELLVNRFGAAGRTERLLFRWSELAWLRDNEMRLAQLCRWVLNAENLGLRYGLHLPGFTAPPGLAGKHREACLRALALFPGDAT